MTIACIKKAIKTTLTGSDQTPGTFSEMPAEFAVDGEQSVVNCCRKFDQWQGEIGVSRGYIEGAAKILPQPVKDDQQFARKCVSDLAPQQRDSMLEFEVELMNGLVASRISPLVGIEGHAMTGDVRLEKYFPEQKFDLRGEIDTL